MLNNNIITKSDKTMTLNEKPFVRTYVEDISILTRCSKAESSVIWCCLQYIDYKSNEILLTATRRKDMIEMTGLKMSTINQSISKLKKKHIFIQNEGKLYFHPNLFLSCSEETAAKVYELTIRYELNE